MAVIEGSIQSNDTNGEQTKEKKRKKERMKSFLSGRSSKERSIQQKQGENDMHQQRVPKVKAVDVI